MVASNFSEINFRQDFNLLSGSVLLRTGSNYVQSVLVLVNCVDGGGLMLFNTGSRPFCRAGGFDRSSDDFHGRVDLDVLFISVNAL